MLWILGSKAVAPCNCCIHTDLSETTSLPRPANAKGTGGGGAVLHCPTVFTLNWDTSALRGKHLPHPSLLQGLYWPFFLVSHRWNKSNKSSTENS